MWPKIGKQTVKEFLDDDAMTWAAAGAYYTIFSLFPLTILLITGLSFFVESPEARQRIVDTISRFLPGTASLFEGAINQALQNRGTFSIVGALTLLWTASNVFGKIDQAMSVAWGVRPSGSFISRKLLAFGMVFLAALLMLASLALSSVLTFLRETSQPVLKMIPGGELVWLYAPTVVSLLLITIVLTLTYRFLSNASDIGFRDVWVGAFLAALLWQVAKEGFSFYLGNFANYSAVYGSVGAVIAFLFWIWISFLILLLGAEFAAEYWRERHHVSGDKPQAEESTITSAGRERSIAKKEEEHRRLHD